MGRLGALAVVVLGECVWGMYHHLQPRAAPDCAPVYALLIPFPLHFPDPDKRQAAAEIAGLLLENVHWFPEEMMDEIKVCLRFLVRPEKMEAGWNVGDNLFHPLRVLKWRLTGDNF